MSDENGIVSSPIDNDDALIQGLLAGNQDSLEALESLQNGEFDQKDKAEDAQDFEDISDDDLPEEEDVVIKQEDGDVATKVHTNGVADDSTHHDNDLFEEDPAFDHLFTGGDQSSPPPGPTVNGVKSKHAAKDANASYVSSPEGEDDPFSPTKDQVDTPSHIQDEEDDDSLDDEDDEFVREQRLLFEQARKEREGRLQLGDWGDELPAPPQTQSELFSMIWPQFEPNKPPRFGELLPGKRAYYVPKTPLKPPRPINPSKVSLELAQDQEKSFRLPQPPPQPFIVRQAEAEAEGLVLVEDQDATQQVSDDDIDIDDANDTGPVGGMTWQDLSMLCENWDIIDQTSSADEVVEDLHDDSGFGDDLFGDDEMDIDSENIAKKRKTGHGSFKPIQRLYDFNIPIDDPEVTTARLAKKVHLDLNDPQILIDVQQLGTDAAPRRRPGSHFKRDAAGGLTKQVNKRYNISNDEAYEMLKENHQNKIRSVLGNLTIEHSLPALRLQYPFYKVKLTSREARQFHRPMLNFTPNQAIDFRKPRFIKRKHLRGKELTSIFEKTSDLSQADNSTMLLLEYSEEYPIMLSNFGMGTRMINYYRRKDAQDNSRPKLDIGETAVLLPQDKSPFSIFGNVEPGETTPTISTGMYRAPVFKHESDPRNFLVIRNSTGVDGPSYFLRNIENIHVVGQEFPSVEVPGTHSRKVTDAAKKRLRMLSWRIYSKNTRLNKAAALKNDMILKHLPGSDIPQNRSKMREFMNYDKDRGWVPKEGDVVPSEEQVRSMIRPEDVCLLESMQVGERHLLDAGYNKSEDEMENDDDEDKDGQSLDQQLAPWQTSKNFLNACQGKAMLQLHGEGDPSGRGQAFSLIRTSMKGGFRDLGEGVDDRLDAKKLKENGGHSYNVARQQKAYNDAIRRIWQAQKSSLSSAVEQSDNDMEDDQDDLGTPSAPSRPSKSAQGRSRRDDDASSVFSRYSAASDTGKVLKITRYVRDKYGKEERQQEIVRDPRVIREYVKRRKAIDLSALSLGELKPSGDLEYDERQKQILLDELARLERNKERRVARERMKGIMPGSPGDAGSPSADGDSSKPRRTNTGGTSRKCANCGQTGHIKTNKKLCPMLNGTIKLDDGAGDSAFGGGSTTSTPMPSTPGLGPPSTPF